jgi:hypothetical protein
MDELKTEVFSIDEPEPEEFPEDEPEPKSILPNATEDTEKSLDTVRNPVEELDPRGDLTLIAGENKVAFRVCSRSLARSSRNWEIMLYGPFAEGKAQQIRDQWEVVLPEDNPVGLRLVLRAIHLGPSATPPVLDEPTLFDALVICDKYVMVEFLKPFWRGWIKSLPSLHEWPHPISTSTTRQLWIAYTLGDRGLYWSGLKRCLSMLVYHPDSSRIAVDKHTRHNFTDDPCLTSLGILRKYNISFDAASITF